MTTDRKKLSKQQRSKLLSILWINLYPVDSAVCLVDTYPLDSNLSGLGCWKAG